MGKYLKRWGLTFQRPDKRAVEQDPEAVRVWCEESWPAIRAKAGAEGAEVLFGDQVGIRSDQVTGRTRGAKGATPVVRRTGNRFSVNAMSAISTRSRMPFMVLTEIFDARVMCRFLARIVGRFDRRVHLIVDRHSAHRSKSVRARPADHADEIELHFLPSHSPEPNPDELAGADPKRSPPRAHRGRNQNELAAGTRRFLHRRQRQPYVVTGCFKPRTSATSSTTEPHGFLINRAPDSAAFVSPWTTTARGRSAANDSSRPSGAEASRTAHRRPPRSGIRVRAGRDRSGRSGTVRRRGAGRCARPGPPALAARGPGRRNTSVRRGRARRLRRRRRTGRTRC
ncbi:IS630 family transposase [Streptomyces sp. NPDC057217]|uniref:IS630 family transposase n=1 Tax=Streptomyces sp. NPDC057217 TaxID=3346054 RepID=UPI00362E84A5